VDPEAIFDIAKRVLDIPRGAVPERDYGEAESRVPALRRAEKSMEVSEPQFMLGASADWPERGDARLRRELVGRLAAELIAGESSPLYIRLYSEGLIKPDFINAFESTSGIAYTLFGGSSPDPDRVLDEISAEAARVHAPESRAELDALLARVKKAEYGALIRSLDSFSRVCSGAAEAYFSGYDFFTAADVLRDITLDEILSFAEVNLKPENFALSVVSPKS
jgi:predicted Zn-dependent peptidase